MYLYICVYNTSMDKCDTYLKDYCNTVHAVCENINKKPNYRHRTSRRLYPGYRHNETQNQCMSIIILLLPCDT